MTTPVLKVDAAGVTAGSLQQNVDGLNSRQKDAFGGDLALTPATPQAQWGGVVGLGLAEVGEAGVRIAGALNVDSVKGTLLDVLGSPLDVRRLGATHSRVVATLTGVGGTIVPARSRARTAAGDEFETLEDVTVQAVGVDTVMQSVEAGAIEAAAGALNRIVTGVPGWETVTNAAAAVLGRPRQTDSVYRRLYRERTAHSSNGPVTALKAALIEAGAERNVVVRNNTNMAAVNQLWTVPPHSIFAIAEGGLAADIQRAIENHRGMGAATLTAIVGGALPMGGIAALSSPYTLAWRGTDYTVADGDWTAASDNAARAAAITATITATLGVTVAWTGHRFIGQYEWDPDDTTAAFDASALATALGLNPDAATESPGPFVRPTERALDVSFSLTRRTGFPGNGLILIQANVLARVGGMDAITGLTLTEDERDAIRERLERIGAPDGYRIGEEVWANDILSAAESVPGTRITSLTVQVDSTDVSGVAVSLDALYTLQSSDLTITVA